jgi:nucleoside-diphosphate-sugar epimerase
LALDDGVEVLYKAAHTSGRMVFGQACPGVCGPDGTPNRCDIASDGSKHVLKMQPKLLITGGCGFIGTHLAERLAGRYRLVLFDNLRRDSLQYVPALRTMSDVEVVYGDILDRDKVRAVVDGAAGVIHLAAIAGVSNYYERPVETLKVNVQGTFDLLEAMVDAGLNRLIYFSSSEVYGPQAENVVEADSMMVSGPVSDKRWVYAVSKLAGEHAVLRSGETYGLNCTCVRPFNVYGPRQTGEGAIGNFCRALVRDEAIQIYGDGTEIRAWCYVSDMVEAVETMLDNEASFGLSFNIGNPEARCTAEELAKMLVRINGGGRIEKISRAHSPIPIRYPDTGLACERLDFRPCVGLEQGLGETLAWFKEIEQ